MKKLLSLTLVLATIITMFSATPLKVDAAGGKGFDQISRNKYAKVYTLSKTGRTTPYTSASLSTRGSVTFGRSSTAYIDNTTDELYLCSVGKTNNKWWAYVSYPVGKKRAFAYIPLSAITSNNGSHVKAISSGKFYCSYRKGVSTSRSYYVSAGETTYLIGVSGNQYQIIYPIGNLWRIGWCAKSDYVKNCVNTPAKESTSKLTTSNKIQFTYSSGKTGYTTSSNSTLVVNGTKIPVGSTCYTYTSNGKYKTVKTYSGYTYVKVGTKYVNMNGWQCCAYARYIQYLLYGSQEFHNSRFVDLKEASYKTATAATIERWVKAAGVGAHIRSTRPHSLVVIGINDNGFYYTDSNVSGSNQIRVGYYTWKDFANSNYKKIEYICYYK